jgi:N-acetyl-1-D-myo-inositol-2-amino-2-deoxy-alpha-D-glucopyranoside deacetylase
VPSVADTPRALLAVHAHPDDECITTGGILIRYAAEGLRTVLVTCTDGAVGEISDPSLATPENLVQVRAAELDEAVRILKVSRLAKLGYRDSGMAGTDDNQHPDSFHQANLKDAVAKVVEIMREERPRVVVTYDENGGYGHPDHIRAHQVAVAAFDAVAGEPWAPSRLFYAVVPRSAFAKFGELVRKAGIEMPFSETGDTPPFGVDDDVVTTTVDVSGFVAEKRAALTAHRTQMGENMFFMRLPAEVFGQIFGREHFQLVRGDAQGADTDLFGGL